MTKKYEINVWDGTRYGTRPDCGTVISIHEQSSYDPHTPAATHEFSVNYQIENDWEYAWPEFKNEANWPKPVADKITEMLVALDKQNS